MPHKGYKQTEEHKRKLSAAKVGMYSDEKHPQWKGVNASYRAAHKWIERKLGTPRQCESCGVVNEKQHQMHWANVSNRYLREVTDWIRLCAKCHGAYDSSKRKLKCT